MKETETSKLQRAWTLQEKIEYIEYSIMELDSIIESGEHNRYDVKSHREAREIYAQQLKMLTYNPQLSIFD